MTSFPKESIPYLKARTFLEKKKDEIAALADEFDFEFANPSLQRALNAAVDQLQTGYRLERQGNLTMAFTCYEQSMDLMWAYVAEVHRMYAAVWIMDSRHRLEQARPSPHRNEMSQLHATARERYRKARAVKRERPKDSVGYYVEARDIARSIYDQIEVRQYWLSDDILRFSILLFIILMIALYLIASFF